MGNRQVFYDNTMMAAYQTCQQLFLLKHIRGYVPDRVSMPLYFGQYMHDSLSQWYEHQDLEKALSVFSSYTDNQWDEKRTASRGMEIMSKYIERYPTEPFEIIANEVPFSFPMFSTAGTTFNLVGRIDLVVSWYKNIYGLDHKTTSQLGKTYFNQFDLNRQMLGYNLAILRMYDELDKDVHGMIINALAVYVSNYKFERHIATYTKRNLNTYSKYVPAIMQEMDYKEQTWEKTHDESLFSPNWDACEYYGHCDFKDVCTSARPEGVLEENYKVDKWDPRVENNLV